MKRKITFVLAVFGATLLAMAVQKPVFLAWYAAEAAGAGFGGWCAVIWHGLSLDATVAGYVTALPLLLTLLSCWVRFPERLWRRVMTGYFVLVALLTAVVFAVDVALYEHWGFRLDSTILIYLADPKEAMASVDWALGVRQTLLGGGYTDIPLRRELKAQRAARFARDAALSAAGRGRLPGDPRRYGGFGGQRVEGLFQLRNVPQPCGDEPRLFVSVEFGR
mgnify:CR=1 FL=1